MALQLLQCTEADAPRVFALVSIAFGHEHPYIDAVFPAHSAPEGRHTGGLRMLNMMQIDPNTHFMKVVDPAIKPDGTGNEIMGIAKWNVYDNVVPEETELGGDWWKEDVYKTGDTEEERKEYAKVLFWEYLVERRKAIRESGGNLVSLDLLVVEPKHQYRGAGSILVQHGIDIADRMGVEAVVEASSNGKHLYEKKGFRMEKFVSLDNVPEKWASRPRQVFYWMRRPKLANGRRTGDVEELAKVGGQ